MNAACGRQKWLAVEPAGPVKQVRHLLLDRVSAGCYVYWLPGAFRGCRSRQPYPPRRRWFTADFVTRA